MYIERDVFVQDDGFMAIGVQAINSGTSCLRQYRLGSVGHSVEAGGSVLKAEIDL